MPSGSKPGERRGGRKPGTPNKFSLSVREAVLETFERLGGVEHMTAWAADHPAEFYRIAAKLIPQAIEGSMQHTHTVLARELDDDALASIAAGGREGADSAAVGAKVPPTAH